MKKKFFKKIFVFSIVFSYLFLQKTNAQLGGGNTYQFLNIPTSARVSALGGNVLAVKDNDINLAALNPSLLNKTMNNKLTMTYMKYFAGVNMGYVGYAKTIGNIGSFNAGMQYLNYGTFTRADANGETDGNFTAGEYALNLAWGKELRDSNFSVGANLKSIYSVFEQYKSFGMAADIAGTYYNEKIKFGSALVIKNIGKQLTTSTDNTSEKLPFEIQLGLSKRLLHAPFRFSVVYENLEKFKLTYKDTTQKKSTFNSISNENTKSKNDFFDNALRHIVVGAEILPTKNISLRIGYNYQRRQELKLATKQGVVGFSFGLGINTSKFSIDYTRAIYHLAGASNYFTFGINFSSFYTKKPNVARITENM